MGSCNFNQDVINNIDGSQTTDNALGIVNCATQTTENYKSYRPYFVVDRQFLTIDGKRESSEYGQFDGDCCYQITSATVPSSCSDISFTDANGTSIKLETVTNSLIPGSGKYTIQKTDSQYDNSLVNICGIKKTNSTAESGASGATATGASGAAATGAATGAVAAAATSANNEIQSNEAIIQEDAKTEGGIKGLVLLVISAILSTLLYVIFLLGPFLFWTKFAPNTIIKGENNCNAGRTILDRFFSYDETKVPYAWEKYANCRPPRQPSASVDKCMDENQFKINSTTNQDLWSHVESLIRGFPYYLIKPNREKILENYKGLPLLGTTLFLCSIIFGLLFFPIYQNYTVNDNIIAGKITEIIIGFIVVLAIMLLITSVWIKITEIKWVIGISILSGLLIALGLIIKNFVIQDNKIGKLGSIINSSVFTVATFIGMASIVKLKNEDNNDYNFPDAFAKGLYYIRKSFVTGYKSSVKNSNKRVNNILKFIGSLPIPDWIFVMGGSFIIPLVL